MTITNIFLIKQHYCITNCSTFSVFCTINLHYYYYYQMCKHLSKLTISPAMVWGRGEYLWSFVLPRFFKQMLIFSEKKTIKNIILQLKKHTIRKTIAILRNKEKINHKVYDATVILKFDSCQYFLRKSFLPRNFMTKIS